MADDCLQPTTVNCQPPTANSTSTSENGQSYRCTTAILNNVQLDDDLCFRATRSRDPRFDGRFFTAVTTTRIYCRPICPAKAARREHLRFFAYAAAAERAGFRPCLRCRPEVAPWTPAWNGTSATVTRALRLIGEGALDDGDVDALAARLGVTSRQVRRLFDEHVGAPPVAVAQARRVHFARTLLVETTLPISEVAFAAGFASLRRFNAAMRNAYRMPPRAMRRGHASDDAITLRLPYRAPYDWNGMLEFLGRRAIPGVECVSGGEYRRTIALGGAAGVLRVRDDGGALAVSVPRAFTRQLKTVVDRVRRMFDLFADPQAIASHLERDDVIRPLIQRWPAKRPTKCPTAILPTRRIPIYGCLSKPRPSRRMARHVLRPLPILLILPVMLNMCMGSRSM